MYIVYEWLIHGLKSVATKAATAATVPTHQTQYSPSHLTLEVRLTPLFAIIIPLRFKEVKTDYTIYYKPPTRFAVVKTDWLNDYMPPKCFVVVKTDSPNFYKPPAHFMEMKTNSPNSY